MTVKEGGSDSAPAEVAILRDPSLFDGNSVASFDIISSEKLNKALVAWGHKMGPINRPTPTLAHGLFYGKELVAVAAADHLMAPRCAGYTRKQAVELSRVCASRRDLCRVVLRMWREFAFPMISAMRGVTVAISYQDAALHNGDLYRFDGWERVHFSHSGKDTRSGRPGRDKWVWVWPRTERQ